MDGCTLIDVIRTPRVLSMAAFDWIITYIGAYLLAWAMFNVLTYFGLVKNKTDYFNMLVFGTFGLLIGVAIFLHYWLGVSTVIGYYLGLNSYPIVVKCFNMTLSGMSTAGLDVHDNI